MLEDAAAPVLVATGVVAKISAWSGIGGGVSAGVCGRSGFAGGVSWHPQRMRTRRHDVRQHCLIVALGWETKPLAGEG
jgi:hypothetical protein